MRCGTPAVLVIVTALAVGCDAERPPESGPDRNWEGGRSQEIALSARAPREGTVGVGADGGAGVSPSVYANSFTRGDPLTLEEFEDPEPVTVGRRARLGNSRMETRSLRLLGRSPDRSRGRRGSGVGSRWRPPAGWFLALPFIRLPGQPSPARRTRSRPQPG